MATNSRYTVRAREDDPEHDEGDYEDDLDYIMDAEAADHEIEMEDVEQGGSGDEDEGGDEDHEREEGDSPEDPARVITLDELREWSSAGKFPRSQVRCKLSTL